MNHQLTYTASTCFHDILHEIIYRRNEIRGNLTFHHFSAIQHVISNTNMSEKIDLEKFTDILPLLLEVIDFFKSNRDSYSLDTKDYTKHMVTRIRNTIDVALIRSFF